MMICNLRLIIILLLGGFTFDARAQHNLIPKVVRSHFPEPIGQAIGMTDGMYIERDSFNVKIYTERESGARINGYYDILSFGHFESPLPNHSMKGHFMNGLRQGAWIIYGYSNFYDYTETYRRGIRHGPFIALDSAGRPLYHTSFTNGTGYFKRFHRNGRVAYEVLFWRNQPHGWAYTYAPDGTLTSETFYQHGQVVRTSKPQGVR